MPATNMTVKIGERSYNVTVDSDAITVNGDVVLVDDVHVEGPAVVVFRSGTRMLRAILDSYPHEHFVLFSGREFPVTFETERDLLLQRFSGQGRAEHHHEEIRASMPGLVVRVVAKPGSAVTKGEAVVILEAMKMENEVRAPTGGIIKEVRVKNGQAVEKGELLVVLE
jgi:acetyl/propionyl-CoA carboxylase alpha subunit